MSQLSKIFAVFALIASVPNLATAQSVFIGPKIDYSISTGVPSEVATNGSPARFNLGISTTIPVKTQLNLRLAALYRIENGGISTTYDEQSRPQPSAGRIDVVEPGFGGPQVLSTIKTSSFEFQTALYFPLADLDTSGSKLSIGLGALVDALLSGTQVDDYSAVPEFGDSTASFTYASQIGFGALVGLGVNFPIGSNQINFDFQYVFRDPKTVEFENSNPVLKAPVGWLVGGGLRLGFSFEFGL